MTDTPVDMIEIAAAAMAASDWPGRDLFSKRDFTDWGRADYRRRTRAVIASLREHGPSDAQVEAGGKAAFEVGAPDTEETSAGVIYRAMLDALLQPKPDISS